MKEGSAEPDSWLLLMVRRYSLEWRVGRPVSRSRHNHAQYRFSLVWLCSQQLHWYLKAVWLQ